MLHQRDCLALLAGAAQCAPPGAYMTQHPGEYRSYTHA